MTSTELGIKQVKLSLREHKLHVNDPTQLSLLITLKKCFRIRYKQEHGGYQMGICWVQLNMKTPF